MCRYETLEVASTGWEGIIEKGFYNKPSMAKIVGNPAMVHWIEDVK
jgi:hypothetical protein